MRPPTGSKSRARRPEPPGLATRRAAVTIIRAVLVERRALDDTLAHHTTKGELQPLEPRDRAHARLVVATTLRRLGQIDAALAHFLAKGYPAERGSLREILRTAAAQLLFLDAAPHAVVSLAVTLTQRDAQARRYEKLVNAVLRRLAEQGHAIVAAQDAARLNTPDWLWESWSSAYGEPTAREIAEAHLAEPPLDITPRSEPERWAQALGGTLLPTGTIRRPLDGRIEDLPGYAEGQWWVQDCAAALPVRLLGDVTGKRVLDLCAAPGGKTAQLVTAGAQVTAVDISAARIQRMQANLRRLSLQAECVVADATSWQPVEPVSRPFDAVLLDAPCTATGTIRRHPDISHLKGRRDVERMAAVQDRLLRRAIELVRPGGIVVFCTCSLEPEEGPGRLAQLCAESSRGHLVPVTAREIYGRADWLTTEGFLRTLPCQSVGIDGVVETPGYRGLDGFFAARLQRLG